MAERGTPAEEIDTSRPHPARMYDFFLGGKDNYEIDRIAAHRIMETAPEVLVSVRENRAFMQRAVRFLVGNGIRQILDIGTGLPTSPNVHEVAHEISSDVRVAYVDNDPIVNVHANALMSGRGVGNTSIVMADLHDPQAIIDHPDVRKVIDFDQPVGLSLVAIAHFIADAQDPWGIVATLRDALPAGSYLMLSHTANDIYRDRTDAEAVYNSSTAALKLRSHAEILRFFDGFDLLEPGLVQVPFWRPDGPLPGDARGVGYYGGVGRL
ncbi:SAM-dependent methyltransferase [Streptomyces pinistramenti]|uniref:SAM-dependent methyltransferase n=1 Tax=Streptomyces pinistramenti TaxID=2884812 RepID=UPI001D073C27|nr:SAM-dependent methyltransferase [Streptomyces pinistramenti]MCB5908822.1 SAM-dependent methyltransferase [Streptomyces pinistramenti]